ncbi:MAG: hypothetical protein IK118_02115 [Clostridia bacterium]|nr:hypothetical protein [Clostridia bacterium]
MKTEFKRISLYASNGAKTAADIFIKELTDRGVVCGMTDDRAAAHIALQCASFDAKDRYRVEDTDGGYVFSAQGVRGLLFAVGKFLRKTVYSDGKCMLVCDITGDYIPRRPIRGHQVGYRPTANSYEAWDEEQYRRYYLDMMYFGANTVEHIPGDAGSAKNELMKYSSPEMCAIASRIADEFDLDVSLWMPNSEATDEEALSKKEPVFAAIPRIDAVFIPGSDPGDLAPDLLFHRAEVLSDALKKYHPDAQIWISAQAPHSSPDWGDAFIREIEKKPPFVFGVIQGPNRAMELDELRKRVPAGYPIRLYPDITHNVRCEYPVHFPNDNWHYAWKAALSRESVDPRAKEMRRIHRMTSPYVVGSVSYSEGINDDFNKMIWSAMDWSGDADLRESALDYARLFFPGCDPETVADALLGLEQNWESAPEESAPVEPTLEKWLSLTDDDPTIFGNWRYVMHLFRASCDALIRRRRIFDLSLIAEARAAAETESFDSVLDILSREYPEDITDLRTKLNEYAAILFEQIGLQTDVSHFIASGWERGAVLDTIDNPLTDKEYYIEKLSHVPAGLPKKVFMQKLFGRTKTAEDELYYSVALHGLEGAGCAQEYFPYLNFIADNPTRRGLLPAGCFDIFDNYTFRLKAGGLDGSADYVLRIVYASRKNGSAHHRITVNGTLVYEGAQFGRRDEEYDALFLPEGLESAVYEFPGSLFDNGCAEIALSEPTMGVMFTELFLNKKGRI